MADDTAGISVDVHASGANQVATLISNMAAGKVPLQTVVDSVARIENLLKVMQVMILDLQSQGGQTMLDVSKIAAAVDSIEGVEASTIAALQGLSGEVRTLKDEIAGLSGPDVQAKLDDFANRLDAGAQAIATAVAANQPDAPPAPTPAAPAADVPPTP